LENRVLVLPKTKNREFRSVPFTPTLVVNLHAIMYQDFAANMRQDFAAKVYQ
jgi:hypothetical protein